MIVVLDSGIWISALQFGGILRLALEKAFLVDRIAYCLDIESEVSRVLVKKMGWEPSRVEESLRKYLGEASRVPVHGTVIGACRDPKDDMVIECAFNAHADLIVTGDHDLLSLGENESIRIVTSRQYVFGT